MNMACSEAKVHLVADGGLKRVDVKLLFPGV